MEEEKRLTEEEKSLSEETTATVTEAQENEAPAVPDTSAFTEDAPTNTASEEEAPAETSEAEPSAPLPPAISP